VTAEASSRGSARWARAAVAIVTLALVAMFARGVDWGRALSTIAHADPTFVVLATMANLGSVIVRALRWRIFLGPVGVVPAGFTVRATLAGAALNNVLVANGGDAARVAAVSRRARISSADVLATLAVDRFCDLVTYGVIFVVAAFSLPLPAELAQWRVAGIAAIVALTALVSVLVWRGQHARYEDRADGADTLASRVRRYASRLVATLSRVATPTRLLGGFALACVAWAGQWATFHLSARAAAFPITAAGSLLALLTVNASFLVRLTPGNVGVFQLLYALAATAGGLNRDGAVAVAFLISLVQYIPVTTIGLVLGTTVVRRGERPVTTSSTRDDDIVTMRTGASRERRT